MTVLLYYQVWRVMSNTPMTKEEITDLLTKDLVYKSDKTAYSKKVYLALKQLKDEGKIVLEMRMRGDQLLPCYRLNNGHTANDLTTREKIVNAMSKDCWMTTNDILVNIFGEDESSARSIHFSRVSRALYTMAEKGIVLKRKSHICTDYGTKLNEWLLVA